MELPIKRSLLFTIAIALLQACVPAETVAPAASPVVNNDVTYTVTVNIPEAPAARPQGSRSANAAASFAIVDLDRTTGTITKIHNIKNASQNDDDSWAVIVESNPNAASFIIVHKNDNAPTVCINACSLPSNSIYAPLDSTDIDVDTLSTIATEAILEEGEEISLQETIDLVDAIQVLSGSLEVMEGSQTLDEYIDDQEQVLDHEINREVYIVLGIPSRPLNDTGQIMCADYHWESSEAGSEVVAASGADQFLCADYGVTQTLDGFDSNGSMVRAGQDAVYGRDVTHSDDSDGHLGFSYTKLDYNGDVHIDDCAAYDVNSNGLSKSEVLNCYDANPWFCAKDNVTGLIWEVKTHNAGFRSNGHKYSWYNSSGINDGGGAGTGGGGSCEAGSSCQSNLNDTEKYVSDINTLTLCGATNWRLPSKEELDSLLNYGSTDSIDVDFRHFPNTMNSLYWTSTPYSIDDAWYTNFNGGLNGGGFIGKNAGWFVRLVRDSN